MKATVERRGTRFAKPLALGLAILSLFFLVQITAHGHENGRPDTACRICQVAHVAVGLAVSAVALNVPFAPVGMLARTAPESELESFRSYASSRAPPTSAL
jgi:hypothetical protein